MGSKFLPHRFSDKKQIFVCIAIIVAIHFIHYFGTGLNECKYSLFEDNEILQNSVRIKENGVFQVYSKQIKYELRGRFRPLYLVYRMSTCSVFGNNIQWHHHFFYTIFVINTFLLLWWGYVFGFAPFLSLVFVLMVVIGPQAAIGWRLANGENIALLFLNGGILCFLYSLKTEKRWLNIAAWCLVVLATFCKESFLFCFGLFPLLYLNMENGVANWKKLRLIGCIAFVFICLYIFCIRVLLQNPDEMKYAGSSITLKDILDLQFGGNLSNGLEINYYRIWQTFIFHGSTFQPYVLLLVLGIAAVCLNSKKHRKVAFGSMALVLALLVLHKLLYLRLSLFKIYLFPVIVAIGFQITQYINIFYATHSKIVFRILLLISLVVLISQGMQAYSLAEEYVNENLVAVKVTDTLFIYSNNQNIYLQVDPLLYAECIYGIKTRLSSMGYKGKIFCTPFEEGDTVEALRIMRFTDAAFVPFMRKVFYTQFSNSITSLKPETSLDENKIWVLIKRPLASLPKFREKDMINYVQQTYRVGGFYTISTLIPHSNLQF